MTILIIILCVIGGLITLVLLLAAVTKKAYALEREVTINRSVSDVYNYVRIVKNSDYYSKWVMLDPNSKKEYRGTDGTVGFIYAWDSTHKNVGQGEQEITKLIDNQRIEFELRFFKPFKGVAHGYFAFEATGDQTKLKWGFASKMPYPMNIMLVLMNMEKMLGNDLQEGLDNLKKVMEE